MDPFDIAWQLLKEVGVEGPADPHRPGEYREDSLPPEAYDDQLEEALAEEARLRGLPTDESELPPPPGPKDTMRMMPPRTDDFSGLPPHMQGYARQLSALRGRPPQGTSVQDPNQVLRSMSPIDLAMDMLQKRTPRSFIGGAEDRGAYQNLLESLEADDAHRGADNSLALYNRRLGQPTGDLTQDDWQNELDADAAEWNESVDGPHADDYSDHDFDEMSPSDIPIDDPMAHYELGMEHEAARAAGMEEPKIDEGEDLDDEDEWSAPGRGAVGGDAFQHRTFSLQDPESRGPSL